MPETKSDETVSRGIKRKQYEPPEEPLSVRISGKLHHGMKEVHKASKKAKVFETQKIVKRLKDVRKKNDKEEDVVAFEAELNTLKEVDHDSIGNSAFRTKVLKDHALRDNEDVRAAIQKELEGNLIVPAASGTTLAKIQARLLSSKILATQVTASLNSIKVLLDPSLKQRDNIDNKKSHAPPSDQLPARHSKVQKSSKSNGVPDVRRSENAVVPTAEGAGDETPDASQDDAGWESGSIDGADEINDDGWESGSIGNSPDHEATEGGESGEESDSEDEELAVKPFNPTQHKSKLLAPTKSAKQTSSKIESTFLPSLSVGFVRGSDDSDFSDAETAADDMPKKNRRGQRARQAIWEKKFGRNANHKKKEAATIAAAQKAKGHARPINSGSNSITSRQGPPGSTADAGWGGRSKDASQPSGRTGQSSVKQANTNKADIAKLHPSWEAKRKLKEKEAVGIVPSQGKKIKFT